MYKYVLLALYFKEKKNVPAESTSIFLFMVWLVLLYYRSR